MLGRLATAAPPPPPGVPPVDRRAERETAVAAVVAGRRRVTPIEACPVADCTSWAAPAGGYGTSATAAVALVAHLGVVHPQVAVPAAAATSIPAAPTDAADMVVAVDALPDDDPAVAADERVVGYPRLPPPRRVRAVLAADAPGGDTHGGRRPALHAWGCVPTRAGRGGCLCCSWPRRPSGLPRAARRGGACRRGYRGRPPLRG